MSRRQHPRLIGPFEGTWVQGGREQRCQIGDLSLGGCFIHERQAPPVGAAVHVSLALPSGSSPAFAGRVVDSEWQSGFAVVFTPMTADIQRQLNDVMGQLRGRRRTA